MFIISFIPKTNEMIKETLDSLRLKNLFDNVGWPLANDHIAILRNDSDIIGSYDAAVDSTDFMFSSIPRGKTFKGRFGVHFTKSFGGNHISIALTDKHKDFIKLERSWVFNVGQGMSRRQVRIYDTRGYITLEEPQLGFDGKKTDIDLVKMDVEIHKGNKYYKSPALSKGCPTINVSVYDKFLKDIFSKITGNFMNTEFEIIIEPLPNKEDEKYSDFNKLHNGLLNIRKSRHENTLKDVEL
jgi:hypothetical protein